MLSSTLTLTMVLVGCMTSSLSLSTLASKVESNSHGAPATSPLDSPPIDDPSGFLNSQGQHLYLYAANDLSPRTTSNGSLHEAAEYRLFADMMRYYNKHVRPRKINSEAILLEITYSLMALNFVDERQQILGTTAYLTCHWNDEFLRWDPDKYDNLTSIVLDPTLVWLPDIGIDNSAEEIYQQEHRTQFRVIVTYQGLVTWAPGGKWVTSCRLDVTYYPYDSQECAIVLTNWAYNGWQVNLTVSSDVIDISDYNLNEEWEVVTTQSVRGERWYGNPYPYVKFTLHLRRKFMYHLLNILLPCTMMSGLIMLVFLLPAESGEKISLGITVLLSFSVFLLMIAESLPQTSDNLPWIGFYLTFVMMASSSSLLVTVLVLNIHHSSPTKRVPHWLRFIVRWMCFAIRRDNPLDRSRSRHQGNTSSCSDKDDIVSTTLNTKQPFLLSIRNLRQKSSPITDFRSNFYRHSNLQSHHQHCPNSPGPYLNRQTINNSMFNPSLSQSQFEELKALCNEDPSNTMCFGDKCFGVSNSKSSTSTQKDVPNDVIKRHPVVFESRVAAGPMFAAANAVLFPNNDSSEGTTTATTTTTTPIATVPTTGDARNERDGNQQQAEKKRISRYLDDLAVKMKEAEYDEVNKEEWRFAAMAIDRFFFYIFTILILSSSLLVCVALPFGRDYFKFGAHPEDGL